MQETMEEVTALYTATFGAPPESIDKVPQSGSDRVYYRVAGPVMCIATTSKNIKESQTFLQFSKHFQQRGCPVPAIYAVNEEETIYLQEDFGDISLLNELEQHGYTEHVYGLFQQSLQQLAQRLQLLFGESCRLQLSCTAGHFHSEFCLPLEALDVHTQHTHR